MHLKCLELIGVVDNAGLDPDFDDFNIDLMAYCTSSCYKGFGDDDEGFYAVYR